MFQALNDTVSLADINNATVIEAMCIENVLASVKVNKSAVSSGELATRFSWIQYRQVCSLSCRSNDVSFSIIMTCPRPWILCKNSKSSGSTSQYTLLVFCFCHVRASAIAGSICLIAWLFAKDIDGD